MNWLRPRVVGALVCLVAACVSGVFGVDGWGWFLFVAFLMMP